MSGMIFQATCVVMGHREKRSEEEKYKKYDGNKFDLAIKVSDRSEIFELTIPFGTLPDVVDLLRSKVDTFEPVVVQGGCFQLVESSWTPREERRQFDPLSFSRVASSTLEQLKTAALHFPLVKPEFQAS